MRISTHATSSAVDEQQLAIEVLQTIAPVLRIASNVVRAFAPDERVVLAARLAD